MNRTFKIQTLSGNSSRSLGVDPTIIVTGGLTIAQQLFPGLFGNNRTPITMTDWNQMFPGGGYWSTLLKQYLASKIHYDVDMKYLYPHVGGNGWSKGEIAQFVQMHHQEICPELPTTCWKSASQQLCMECMQKFEQILSTERRTGGTQPAGLFPGMTGGLDLTTIAIVAGGIFLLVALSKR